jgi:hypothetical protein
MLTRVQQHALDRFAKSLLTLGDDALIDTYHQAWEDHRAARAEGSDNNLSKAYAMSVPRHRKGIPSRARIKGLISRYEFPVSVGSQSAPMGTLPCCSFS